MSTAVVATEKKDGDTGGESYLKAVAQALRALGFDISGVIGEGVYGVVLQAKNFTTQRTEAIKVMPSHKSYGIMPVNALREITALTRAAHHNVMAAKGVLVFDDGTTALRMSMYNCTLRTLLQRHCRYFLPFDVVRYLFSEIVKGVAAMDAQFGIVHRDLKPENILIRWEGKQVAVADWGMSRGGIGVLLPIDTVFTREVVSMYYAPPETLTGAGLYTSTIDVWSLGVILAEMLSGKMIFLNSSSCATTRRGFVLQAVLEVLGTPSDKKDVEFFRKSCGIDVSALETRHVRMLKERLGREIPAPTFALLEEMLKFTDRPTIQQLAVSEYVAAAGFPPAGVPFSSCATAPCALQVGKICDTPCISVKVQVSFPCARMLRGISLTHETWQRHALMHGWSLNLFTPRALFQAWRCLQSLGTIRQRVHVWLSAMCISHHLEYPRPLHVSSQELLAATISLAAASVMLIQKRFDVLFVKCIEPSITAVSLHESECIVFSQCRGFLPASPPWANSLLTHAAMQIACETVCHGGEAEEIPLEPFIAACHCTPAHGAAEESPRRLNEVDITLHKMIELRKRIY